MPTALTYAGVQLGFPDADGSIQKWLDRYRPIEEIFNYANPTSTVEGRDRPQGQTGHSVGLPRHNWTYQPPRYRVNTLWWPCTGASRFAQGLFLTNLVNAKKIQTALAQGDGSAQLNMSDSVGSLQLRMWALPLRPLGAIATSNFPLVLVPLVDRRYFWQWCKTGQMFLGPESTWTDLINQIKGGLGASVTTPDAETGGYDTPDWSGFDLWHENAALMLDAYAATVGQRFVADGGTYALRKADEDATLCQSNLDAANVTAGGEFLTVPAAAPGKLTVVFPRRQGGVVYQNGVCDTVTIDGPNTSAPGEVTIHTSFQADYSTRGTQPDNQGQLDNLAQSIAHDYFKWHTKQYSGTVPGVASAWQPTGFDDYLWVHFGASAPQCKSDSEDMDCDFLSDLFDVPWTAHTLIESLPDNFGVDENLCQASAPTAPRTFRTSGIVRVQLTGDFQDRGPLPAVATGRMLFADDYPPTGHMDFDGFDIQVFDTLYRRGSLGFGDRVWAAALPSDSEMFELIEGGSGSNEEIVQVWHPGIDSNALVIPNAQSIQGQWFHTGYVKRYTGNLIVTDEPCWILFVDDFDVQLGKVAAYQGEYYGPGHYVGDATAAGYTFPLYLVKKGAEPAFVMVDGGSAGDLVKSDDFTFDGVVLSASSQTDEQFFTRGPCKITFVDYFTASNASPVIAEVGRIYGPCKLSVTHGSFDLPIYEATIGEQEWEGKLLGSTEVAKGSNGDFTLYGVNGPSSFTVNAEATYKKILRNKFCIVKRINRRLVASQIEC